MKKIDASLKEMFSELGKHDDIARKALRTAQVQSAWKNAIEEVYKDAAALVLQHINAVYILSADTPVFGDRDGVPRKKTSAAANPVPSSDTGTQLVVYADDSLIRSDLDARQEFLKLYLNKQGEHVETFHVLPSRFGMHERHPFVADQTPADSLKPQERERACDSEGNQIEQQTKSKLAPELQEKAEHVENPAVQASLLRAMDADLTRNNPSHKKNTH